jgi:hypothetical protein
MDKQEFKLVIAFTERKFKSMGKEPWELALKILVTGAY